MAENTLIEWATHTFNPWWGCMKVSPACDHCYAERDAKRFAAGRVLWGVSSERRVFGDKHWAGPINWNDAAEASAKKRAAYGLPEERPRVFCASMGDWLDLDGPIAEFVRLLDTIRRTPYLDWLLLTKRIGNLRKRLQEARDYVVAATDTKLREHSLAEWIGAWLDGIPPGNVVLMITVINQAEADRDVPKLLAAPAWRRGLSIEPMLGPIDLTNTHLGGGHGHHEFSPILVGNALKRASTDAPRLHWVIAGGESGPQARASHPDWYRSLRDQCAVAGVPFLFKQWGEWLPISQQDEAFTDRLYRSNRKAALHEDQGAIDDLYGRTCTVPYGVVHHDGSFHEPLEPMAFLQGTGAMTTFRVGKKAAGRLLDGKLHDGYPGARA